MYNRSMKKNYPLLAAAVAGSLVFGGCNRAEYAFRSAAPAYAPVAAPVIASTPVDAQTVQASSSIAAPITVEAPAKQAATVLASARNTATVPAQRPVNQSVVVAQQHTSAMAMQPSTRRRTKSHKTLWIILGIGLALAIVRVIIASNKE